MRWQWFFLIMLGSGFASACRKPAPAAPARLPQPPTVAARLADAVLVWIRPEGWPEPFGPERGSMASTTTGVWDEPVPARTFWITQAGSVWTIAAVRPGLFVAAGADLIEARWDRFRYRLTELPEAAEGENEGLAHCRQVFDGSTEVELNARGTGLVLRDAAEKSDFEMFPVPESIEELDYNASTLREADVVGGLGKYLFVRIVGHEASCGTGSNETAEFHVVDLDARKVVTRDFFDPTDGGPWIRYFDLPMRRRELAPGLKNQLKEYQADAEYNPEDLLFSWMMPIFPAHLTTVAFQTTYRYWAGCRACPQFDGKALVEVLPPELAPFSERHPALALVDSRLPEGWRIGGFSLLTASPARVTQLRGHFDAAGPERK